MRIVRGLFDCVCVCVCVCLSVCVCVSKAINVYDELALTGEYIMNV